MKGYLCLELAVRRKSNCLQGKVILDLDCIISLVGSYYSNVTLQIDMSHFAYACKTEGKNGISRLISKLLLTLDSSLWDRLFVLQNEVF